MGWRKQQAAILSDRLIRDSLRACIIRSGSSSREAKANTECCSDRPRAIISLRFLHPGITRMLRTTASRLLLAAAAAAKGLPTLILRPAAAAAAAAAVATKRTIHYYLALLLQCNFYPRDFLTCWSCSMVDTHSPFAKFTPFQKTRSVPTHRHLWSCDGTAMYRVNRD